MNRTSLGLTTLLAFTALGGCDYSGDFLFAGAIDGMDAIYHINAEDGGDFLLPNEIVNRDEIPDLAIYGEVSPTGSSLKGGITFYFEGNGRDVCVWVDPETAFYNQVISPTQSPPNVQQFQYPNNPFDDGDLDLFIGKSVYYTGSPGDVIGDFVVAYTDSLGNEVPIELSECNQIGYGGAENAHTGRGQPEYCDIRNTELGISYTVLMHTFATPLDDDRLGYGLFLYDGSCADLRTVGGLGQHNGGDECLLIGDTIKATEPDGKGEIDYGPWYGYQEDRAWPGSEAFEITFCNAWIGAADMTEYCEDEIQAKFEAGTTCEWEEVTNDANRCYCGDIRDTPTGGAL